MIKLFLEITGIILIVIGVIWVIIVNILGKYNHNYPKAKRDKLNNFCILIPARYEAKVIEDLLISIQNQSKKVKMEDVIIIVESAEDETVLIASKYQASIFVRKELDLRTKGYALDEAIKDLVSKDKYYDAYFILDADNILDKDFIKNMEKSYIEGYDIAIGYRNFKNGNDSVIASCSGITFTFLNSNGNETKAKQSRNVTLSGTGLFIVGDCLRKWKSFPFHSLTEDYELTLYSIENNLTSTYNKEAIYYDEQPIHYKNTISQRVRWVRGYFCNRIVYIPRFIKLLKNNNNFGSIFTEITGMNPYILMVLGVISYILNQIINIIRIHDFNNSVCTISLIKIVLILFIAYFLFAFMTMVVILKEKNINLNKKMKIKTIFFSPLFFITFIPCAIKAIVKRKVTWDRVEHNRKKC